MVIVQNDITYARVRHVIVCNKSEKRVNSIATKLQIRKRGKRGKEKRRKKQECENKLPQTTAKILYAQQMYNGQL